MNLFATDIYTNVCLVNNYCEEKINDFRNRLAEEGYSEIGAEISGAPAFFAKAEMGSVRFQQRKICWRLLPSAARVRPASAAAHNSPSVRCTPLAYANDLTPCRMALHFDYASAAAPTSSKRPAPKAMRGSSYTAPLALRFLYSF